MGGIGGGNILLLKNKIDNKSSLHSCLSFFELEIYVLFEGNGKSR